MNSPMKDALTEFINNNTSAIEQAMESGSHDLTKDEPVIPDLVNYLSCPSPQPCNKDIEPMSTNEKADTHNTRFDPGHGQTHYNPCPLQDISESSQMCVTGADLVLNQDLQPQHHLGHQNSFEQKKSLYPDSSIQTSSTACAFPDTQLVNASAFAGPGSSSSSSTEMHTALTAGGGESQYCHTAGGGESQYCHTAGGGESQYCHTEPSGQFQVASDADTHSQPTTLMSTDNCVQQTRSETSAGGFQDASVLSSFTSSVGSEVSFGQDGLGFGLLTVNQDPLSNLDRVASQFRAPEKMHVDEPETVYGRAGGIDHFQAGAIHTTSPADLHMQTFSSDAFNAASAFVAQQTPSVADTGLQDCAAASVADQFSSHNFQPSPAVLQGSCVHFQTQANIHPANDVITEQAHFLPQQPESSGSAEASFSCPTQHTCGSSQPSPYQASQFYNSPGLCEATPGVADTFQKSLAPTDCPAPSPSCGPSHQFDLISSSTDCGHFQQSVASLQPHQQSVASLQSQLDLAQFHQNPALDMGFSPSVSLAHGLVQPGVSFHASVATDLSSPAHFPPSAPAESPPHDYLTDTVSASPAQVKDSTAFLGCTTREDPLLSAGMCSQGGGSQSATDYQMSPGHGQGLTASSKTPSDVTMRDFSLEGNLHSPSHRFPDDSFIHLDLEAVVSSLSEEPHSSSTAQNDSILSSVSYQPSYNEYDYSSLSATPVSFQGMSVAADTSTFSEHSKPDTGFTSSCTPALSASTFVSDAGDESSRHQFGSSSFVFAATSEAAPAQTYHQPMQVQDSEPHVTYSYPSTNVSDRIVNNTETAMEVTSSLSDKVAGVTSGMSYEEIHMSIVKAGNELSKEAHDTNILHPRADFCNPPAHTANLDSLGSVPTIFSTSSSELFPTEKPDSNVAAGYNTAAGQTLVLMTSGNEQHESSFSCNTSLSDSITTSSVDSSSIFSGILSDLQAACSSSGAGHDTQHTSATVPNFLENAGPMVSSTHTDSISAAGLMQGPAQGNFIISMAGTPTVSQNLAASASLNPPAVVAMQHADIASSQQQPVVLSTGLQSVAAPGSPQIFATVINPAQVSTASFLGQLQTGGVDQTSSSLASNQLVPTPGMTAAASLDSVSGTASGTFLHMAPAHVERASASPATSVSSIKLAANTLTTQKCSTSSTPVAGLTPVSLSSVSPSQVLASSVSKQPHIIVSLEELQKLLAQQNLSQPPASVPQQQPYTSLSSPQTLVLQKHASHSLKQSQPRLLIKGATLPSQPRQVHPHQQLQQTREKLQLLMHHSQPPDHTPVGKFSQRSSETSALSASQENQQKVANPFSFVSVNQLEQLPQSKLHVLQHPGEQKVRLQLKPAQLLQRHPQTLNLFLQQVPKSGDQKLAPLQLGHQQGTLAQHKSHSDHKPFVHIESHLQNPPHFNQRGLGSTQKTHNLIQLAQMQQELLLLLKQEEKGQEFERQQLHQLHLKHQQHLQPLEKPDKADRACSDSLRKDYKHLHSLLTGETVAGGTQAKVLPPMLNLASNSQGQSGLQLASAGVSSAMPTVTSSSATHMSTAPFSLLPLNSNTSLHLTGTSSSTPLSTLAFVKNIASPAASKTFDLKDFSTEHSSCLPGSLHAQLPVKSEHCSTDQDELDIARHQPALLLQTSTERKRSHTPLSVDLNSPTYSGSEAGSPLASPTICEDGNTQLTLIERSADLHIKSDSMLGADEEDVDDNSSFDVNAFHKRPSAGEFHSTRGNNESVPMKIAKSSIDTTAHLGANSTSLESTFNFGNAVTSASSFSFVFGNKEDNSSELFTFGLNGTATTAATTTTTDTLPHKDGAKSYRLSSSKPVMKTVGLRAAVPTQPVRPMSRKQKEHSLKAYYPSKLDGMELKILEQPEPQHRARYQTEGSRGAIKDASQQGFPVIKLFGYNKPAKLQVFIGDECGRVKPHGFYQACRVFGKNSTACVEQEIEDTTVIEVEMLPENDMTVRLDCVGILKLRNADVERRIGPKRAREKKKTNTRARLVMRCLVVKSDGNQQILQAVSNPIVCTQPVGQPEISRMSLSESSVLGGDSLFIIGKNFKNKGTSVLFQKLDSNEEHVVWQVEADIEQEFFQPTHLICKIPPYQDPTVEQPQLAQIVISCAGKRSDPQAFMYTPATSVKRDTPMDTDHVLSTRSASLASSEALHLNRLVHLTNPASTSSIMFQLPQGSLTGRQTSAMEPTPANTSSQVSQPVKLLDHTTTTSAMAPSSAASAALPASVRPESSLTSLTPGQGQPSFLMEDSVPEPGQNASERSSGLSSAPEPAPVNCVVHSNSDTRTISAVSYAVSDNHQQPSLTSSASAGQVLHSNKLPNKSASAPSKPFFLVVDPVALQSNVGSEKIQQLLQHILEAQSKA